MTTPTPGRDELRFLAIRKWRDGGEETVEYFRTRDAAVQWIAKQAKSGEFQWMIGEYE